MADYPDFSLPVMIVGQAIDRLAVDIVAQTISEVRVDIAKATAVVNVNITNDVIDVNITNSVLDVKITNTSINVVITECQVSIEVKNPTDENGNPIPLKIDIYSQSITLDVNIKSQTTDLDVNISSQSVTLDVNIASSTATLDVNITNTPLSVEIYDCLVEIKVVNPVDEVGEPIPLAIDIYSQSITLDVNIASQSVTLDVNIKSQEAILDVNIASQEFDLNINIAAQTVDVKIVSPSGKTVNMSQTITRREYTTLGLVDGETDTAISVTGRGRLLRLMVNISTSAGNANDVYVYIIADDTQVFVLSPDIVDKMCSGYFSHKTFTSDGYYYPPFICQDASTTEVYYNSTAGKITKARFIFRVDIEFRSSLEIQVYNDSGDSAWVDVDAWLGVYP